MMSVQLNESFLISGKGFLTHAQCPHFYSLSPLYNSTFNVRSLTPIRSKSRSLKNRHEKPSQHNNLIIACVSLMVALTIWMICL